MAAAVKRPIDPDKEAAGFIEYTPYTSKPAGLFVTTYYFRDKDCTQCADFKGQDTTWMKTDVYKTGILQYLKVTETPEFAGWKVLIMTDTLSLEAPTFKSKQAPERLEKHKKEWAEIQNHPNVMFGRVDWPEYAVGKAANTKTIDNAILRALRVRAFVDFPGIPVFLRDADTLFENLVKPLQTEEQKSAFAAKLAAWEFTLWGEIRKVFEAPGSPYRILIASQPHYSRQWHKHPDTGIQTTGCYAAVTSTLGTMEAWTDGSLWRKCLAYLRKHTRIVADAEQGRIPNNLNKPTYIGKDEQLLSYVVLQEVFDQVYFYYLEYISIEGKPVMDVSGDPYAASLKAAGYERYPSPYIKSLGQSLPSPLEGTKEANEKTETTLLNTALVAESMVPETHKALQIVFRHYHDAIRAAMAAPGFVPKQMGGRRRRLRRTRRGKRGYYRRRRSAHVKRR